jgi:hypothetical protein
MPGEFESNRSASEVVNRVISDVDRLRRDGASVAVMHSWPDSAPLALGMLIAALVDKVTFVRLDDLVPREVPRDVEAPL